MHTASRHPGTRFSAIGAALALCLAGGTAWADAPLQSETADALGAGNCQLEASLGRATVRDLPAVKTWDLLGSCGLDGQSQLALGYGQAKLDGAARASAATLMGKTTLLTPDSGRTGWGLAYGLLGSKTAGSGWELDNLSVAVVATRELASGWLGHANLAWNRSWNGDFSTTSWSLGVETTGTWVWAADVFGDDRNKPGASTGFGYDFGGGFSANLSVATLFETPRIRFVTLGAKFAF